MLDNVCPGIFARRLMRSVLAKCLGEEYILPIWQRRFHPILPQFGEPHSQNLIHQEALLGLICFNLIRQIPTMALSL